MQCSRYGSEVTPHESTSCVATQVELTCENQRYNLKDENKVKRSKFRKYDCVTI